MTRRSRILDEIQETAQGLLAAGVIDKRRMEESNLQEKYNMENNLKIKSEYPSFATTKNSCLYLGDAVEVMNRIPESTVDLIFADPPYNLSNGGMTCYAGQRVSVNKGKWDISQGPAKDFEFHQSWISACRRVLKPEGTIWISGTYHSIYACGFALQLGGWHLLNDICWYKPNAAPNLACRMFCASHETLLWARKTKDAKHFFNYEAMKNRHYPKDILKAPGKQMRSVWAITTPVKDEKLYGKHPTQKPLDLLERIVLASCPKDGIVLDPFCGSGTTGVAAVQFGAYFIGIDAEKEYLQNMALPRIEDTEKRDTQWKDGKLFNF